MDNITLNAIKYLLLGVLLIFLSSCSLIKRSHPDGPPSFYVDVSRIRDAVPKNEPPSKFGNPSTYSVYGKRYYTMRSSKHYEATGTASWYGTKFHNVRTSSGEAYNMLAMTAAHKTLPLPTYVEVTNLKNHKRIIVRVNDRGPFVGNRIIDLSYVAARKLGMTPHGTALVHIRAIDPNDYEPNRQQNRDLYLAKKEPRYKPLNRNQKQIGAFKTYAHAHAFKAILVKQQKQPVAIIPPDHDSEFYRVMIG